MPDPDTTLLSRVSAALGRSRPPLEIDAPPSIPEELTRVVRPDVDLVEWFTKTAKENKITVQPVGEGQLPAQLIDWLRAKGCRRIAIAGSPLLDRLALLPALRSAGFDAVSWADISLDQLYDFDCGLTDVSFAIAETGSMAIRSSAAHGRAISLIPPMHVAIVRPQDILADLVDLFAKLGQDGGPPNYTTIITGPSKTADIEMTMVTGVHGPGTVHVFLLQ